MRLSSSSLGSRASVTPTPMVEISGPLRLRHQGGTTVLSRATGLVQNTAPTASHEYYISPSRFEYGFRMNPLSSPRALPPGCASQFFDSSPGVLRSVLLSNASNRS